MKNPKIQAIREKLLKKQQEKEREQAITKSKAEFSEVPTNIRKAEYLEDVVKNNTPLYIELGKGNYNLVRTEIKGEMSVINNIVQITYTLQPRKQYLNENDFYKPLKIKDVSKK